MQQQGNNRMEEEILSGEQFHDENEEEFEICDDNPSSPEDIFFDQVVAALQEIIVDDKFENLQSSFMKQNCHVFQNTQENKIEYMGIFKKYQGLIEKHIEKSLEEMVPGFTMEEFLKLLQERTEQIDEQILEILHSFTDFEIFKGLILDYKSYYEEEERLKVLTVKSNKIPENKKVKGSDNIFSKAPGLELGGKPLVSMKKNPPSSSSNGKKQTKDKNEDQLFVPDLVMTIRPLKKA